MVWKGRLMADELQVIIVDDEEQDRLLARGILEAMGFRTVEAASAADLDSSCLEGIERFPVFLSPTGPRQTQQAKNDD